MIQSQELSESTVNTLNNVVRRVAQRRSLSIEEIDCASTELIKFLQLCADSDLPLAPSAIIDDLWHEFILHTRAYAEFCTFVLGNFVHHVPLSSPDPTSYNRTLQRIKEQFGGLDERFWPSAGTTCDSSCGQQCRSRSSN